MSLVKLPSPLWVRKAVAGMVQQNRSHIDARMAAVDLGSSTAPTLQRISHSYRRHSNLDVKSLPAFLIEQRNQANAWHALPNVANFRFTATIWGLIHWDQPEEADDLVSEFAAGVVDVLAAHHLPVPIGHGYSLYYNDSVPVSNIEYGALEFQNAIVHGFNATYACDVIAGIPDASPQSRIP